MEIKNQIVVLGSVSALTLGGGGVIPENNGHGKYGY